MAVHHPLAGAKYQQCIAVIDETINILLTWGEHRKRKAAPVQDLETVVTPSPSPETVPVAPQVKAVSKPSSRPTAVKSSAIKSLQASGKAIPKPLQAKMAQAKPTATKSAPPEPQPKRPRIEEPKAVPAVTPAVPVKAAPAKTSSPAANAANAGDNDVNKLKARLAALKDKAAQLEAVEAKRAKAQAAAQLPKQGAKATQPTKAAPTVAVKAAAKATTQPAKASAVPPEKVAEQPKSVATEPEVVSERPRPPVPVFEASTAPAASTTAAVEQSAPALIDVGEEPDSDEDMMDDDLMAGLMNRLGSAESPAPDGEMGTNESPPVSAPSETDALKAALVAEDEEEEEEEEEEEGGLEEQVIPPGVAQTVVAGEVEDDGEEGEESEEEYDPFSTDAAEPATA